MEKKLLTAEEIKALADKSYGKLTYRLSLRGFKIHWQEVSMLGPDVLIWAVSRLGLNYKLEGDHYIFTPSPL